MIRFENILKSETFDKSFSKSPIRKLYKGCQFINITIGLV